MRVVISNHSPIVHAADTWIDICKCIFDDFFAAVPNFFPQDATPALSG
ncbi:MAG TPA: hypothetical protein VGB94_07590 [Acidobacteriaceae bacterium]